MNELAQYVTRTFCSIIISIFARAQKNDLRLMRSILASYTLECALEKVECTNRDQKREKTNRKETVYDYIFDACKQKLLNFFVIVFVQNLPNVLISWNGEQESIALNIMCANLNKIFK